jgi:hypothetical protein
VAALLVAALASSAPADSPIALASATCADYSNQADAQRARRHPRRRRRRHLLREPALPLLEPGRHRSDADADAGAKAKGVLQPAVDGAAAELQQL